MTTPFRFGFQSFHADSAKEWREGARQVEDLGYSALHLADHIIGPGPALEATNHPLQTLAAVPATLDFFSEGRLELGLGAGWLQRECDAIGIACDPIGTRIDRLAARDFGTRRGVGRATRADRGRF